LNLRSINLCAAALLVPAFVFGQGATGTPAAPQAQPPADSQAAPKVTSPSQQTQLPVAAPKSKEPDYPDPRTFFIGVFGWATLPSPQPNIIGGVAATGFSTLDNIGKQHPATYGVEASYPITRTGELHFEGFEAKGDGTQTAPNSTTIFATGYTAGSYLSTQYQITGAKLYLDDLLYPFKFPVSKLRFKSLWEVQYVALQATLDAPLAANATSTGTLVSNAVSGTRSVIIPTFGAAVEYAISPHILLRGAATGFGIPHHAELWDAEGTFSYRYSKTWEVRGGYKVMHVKTSPQRDEYITDTISGAFFGVRYHWN
jgi:hypothetical protein